MSDNNIRFFVFSQQQMDLKKSIEKNMGRNAKFGTVVVNGSHRIYTDILTDVSKSSFADARVLISGDIRRIKYNAPAD